MPKIKTHKSTVKRIRVSGSGKLILRKMSITHRSRFKSKRAKANSTKVFAMIPEMAKKIRKVL